MPDDIIISELSNAPQIDDSAVFPLTQDNGGSPATFKGTMSQIAGKIAETTTYANLQTTSKTLVGAINEVAQSGGSAELIGTASGSIATFADGGNGIPLKSCEVEIVAQQAGSGTPSPSNPRPITGFSSVVITNKDDLTTPTTTDTHTITLPETIYGGTAELVGGNGTKTFGVVDLGSLTWNYWSGNRFYAVVDGKTAESVLDIICEVYPTLDGMNVADNCVFCQISNANQRKNIYIQDDSYSHDTTGANNLKTSLNGKLAVYRLATPTAFTFTGATIPTLSGVNNIYANCGDVDLTYFNENADEIAELIKVMT